jgi:hypothetical protein
MTWDEERTCCANLPDVAARNAQDDTPIEVAGKGQNACSIRAGRPLYDFATRFRGNVAVFA